MKLIKLEKHRCNFCNQLTAHLDGQELHYVTHNIENEPEIASKYGVMAAPILILEDDNGKEISRVNGFFRDQVDELVERYKKGE